MIEFTNTQKEQKRKQKEEQKQQKEVHSFINSLYAQLEKDLKNDKGDFIINFARSRKFSAAFSSVSSDNQKLLKDFYKKAYETSLQNYITTHGQITFNIMDVINTYNSILEFIFGNEKHFGAYSSLLQLYKKNKQPITDSVEIIISCESMYNLSYKIRSTEEGYYLFDPSLNPVNKVDEPNESDVKSYNYLDSLSRFLKTSIQKVDVTSAFEIPAEEEKANFTNSENHKNLIITLDDLIKEDEYKVSLTKSNLLHNAVYFDGNIFSFSAVSFIGKEQRNYHFLPWTYANHKIVKDLSDKYGFLFVTTNPTKFLADSDGYLVNKITYISNPIAQTTFACTPENMSNISVWATELSTQGYVALTKELSTYILTQLGFGYDKIDTNFFFLDTDTREIVHFIENEPNFVKRYAYLSAPNNLIEISVNDSNQFFLDKKTIKILAESIVSTGTFSDSSKLPLFGFEKFQITNDNLANNLDNISIDNLPKQLFEYEYGVFAAAGKEILNGKELLYNDWFSEHIKKSGMSINSSLTVKIMNRLSLFSAISYLYSI